MLLTTVHCEIFWFLVLFIEYYKEFTIYWAHCSQWAWGDTVKLRIYIYTDLGLFSTCRILFFCHLCQCQKRKCSAPLNHSCLFCSNRKHLQFSKCLWIWATGILPAGPNTWMATFLLEALNSPRQVFPTQSHPASLSLARSLCQSQTMSVLSPIPHFQAYFRKPWVMYPSFQLSLLGIYGAFWLGTQGTHFK